MFISGLPPKLSTNALRNHFSGRFEVTDAHVIPNRRIGFLGFKSNNMAQNAVDYFNKTFINMSKISVEMAKPVSTFSSIPITTKGALHSKAIMRLTGLKDLLRS